MKLPIKAMKAAVAGIIATVSMVVSIACHRESCGIAENRNTCPRSVQPDGFSGGFSAAAAGAGAAGAGAGAASSGNGAIARGRCLRGVEGKGVSLGKSRFQQSPARGVRLRHSILDDRCGTWHVYQSCKSGD